MGISEQLENALTCVNVPGSSAATVELARTYARLLDEPGVHGKYRIPLNHLVKVFAYYRVSRTMTPTEERGLEAAEEAIKTALSEHSTASDLGPKLLAALTALNLALPATGTGAKTTEAARDDSQPLDAERAEAQRLKLVR